MRGVRRCYLEPLMIKLILAVALASFLPASGAMAHGLQIATTIAVSLLFFLYGARLSRHKIVAGIKNWRLQLWTLASTYLLFPLVGSLFVYWHPLPLDKQSYTGILYLCLMPATVQSAVAMTAVAGGNVAAAVCSASASSLLGIVISPVLVQLLLDVAGDAPNNTLQQMGKICSQLLLPFALGHLLRPYMQAWLERRQRLVSQTDQFSILLVVYGAFSDAVANHLWQRMNALILIAMIFVCLLLLVLILTLNFLAARVLGFTRADTITVLFCGSKKSLVNGVPMANILFPAAQVGMILLPLMLFHQLQLMVCAVIAHYFRRQHGG